MSKTWSTALVVSLMLVLMLVVVPVSGKAVGTVISQGATVFIGEEGLNITPIFTNSSPYTKNVTGLITEADSDPHPVDISGTLTGTGITVSLNGELGIYDTTTYIAPISGNVVGTIDGTFVGTHYYKSGETDVLTATITGYKAGVPFTGTVVGQFAGNPTGVLTATITESAVGSTSTKIGYWASGADLDTTSPRIIDVGSRLHSMSITQTEFSGYTGNWYVVNSASHAERLAFYVEDPQLSLDIIDANSNVVNGKSVAQGTPLTFRINTNMYSLANGKRSTAAVIDTSIPAPIADFTATGNAVSGISLTSTTTGVVDPADLEWSEICLTCPGEPCEYSGSPLLLYLSTGSYKVTLKATNAGGSSIRSYTLTVTTSGVTMSNMQYTPPTAVVSTADTSDGYINIKVKPESGTTYNALWATDTTTALLTNQYVDTQPYYWNDGTSRWQTGHISGAQYDYPQGTYYVTAESNLNGMKDNYKNGGADYTGKTVSEVQVVVISSEKVKIEANKETVIRGKTFSVTVTGKPNSEYMLWLDGVGNMEGNSTETDTIPPRIMANQEGVFIGENGAFQHENSAGATLSEQVPDTPIPSPYYARIVTNTYGVRVIEFTTSSETKGQRYTIRVENSHIPGANAESDELDINVEKGSVTIVAEGDQSYYLGEEIKLSGTNTESSTTFLFIIGPNLQDAGARLKYLDPRHWDVKNGDASTFTQANVNGDGSWSYKWGTATVALDAGMYTLYAVNIPRDREHLEEATYGTTSIVLKKAFVSASTSSSTVAQGDPIKIIGTAEGEPSPGIQVWVLGKNYYNVKSQSVNSDASFLYEIKGSTTKELATGQYFVVVQHPMQNDKFDIVTSTEADYHVWVKNLQLNNGMKIFKLGGSGSLQGSDAAQALIEAISDPNVDDTYTKFQFLVETPYIYITPITDKHIGDKFTISAQTNLAIDDEVLMEVYSSSFTPTQKSQSGEFSGATGTIKVEKGDSGLNKLTFEVDSASFKSDEYIVKAQAVVQDGTGSALFNVLDAGAVIATPTPVATATSVATPVVVTAASTPIPTMAEITALPTESVNTTATTKPSPGYGALVALIGLGAVAFLVARRE